MVRKAAIGIAVIVAIVGALYVAGFRVAMDGSGMFPRFMSDAPDYDALEADRARQRAAPAPAAEVRAPIEPAPPGGSPPGVPESAGESSGPAEPAPRQPSRAVWPDFRGPSRDGRSTEAIRLDWPAEGLRQLWKQPVGLGYASFVVADGRGFTIEQRRRQEVVAAYDVETGRELWTNAWDGEFVESLGGDGPRATPTYHDGRVYVLGALGEFRSLDAATGAVVWRRNILEDSGASNLDWGMSASPLIVDDKVVVLPGGSGGRSVVAYNREKGDVVWRALDDRQAYVSPVLVTLAGTRQIVVVSATRAVGLDPAAGACLSRCSSATTACSCRRATDRVRLSSRSSAMAIGSGRAESGKTRG
jgi:hypothetical protein